MNYLFFLWNKLINRSQSPKDGTKSVYAIFRFIKNKPVAYGFALEGENKHYFISENTAQLRRTLPWYMRFLYPSNMTSSLITTEYIGALSLNLKNRYGISSSEEEMNRLLANYKDSENKKGKN